MFSFYSYVVAARLKEIFGGINFEILAISSQYVFFSVNMFVVDQQKLLSDQNLSADIV